MNTLALSKNRNGRSPTSGQIPTIDQIMVEERAAAFAKRSIKTSAKVAGLKLVMSMMDLTTLEGRDTPGKIAFVCRKAMQPAVVRGGLRLSEFRARREKISRQLRRQSRVGGNRVPGGADAAAAEAPGGAQRRA